MCARGTGQARETRQLQHAVQRVSSMRGADVTDDLAGGAFGRVRVLREIREWVPVAERDFHAKDGAGEGEIAA